MRFISFLLAFLMSTASAFPAAVAQSSQNSDGNSYVAPASQSEISQRGISLKVDVLTPSRGLASSIADLLRDGQYAKVLNNLQMLKRGVWSTRGTGWTRHVNTQFNSGAKILEIFPYVNSSGTNKLLFRAGSKYYDYDIATFTATEIGSGFSATDVPCIRVYGRPSFAGPINAYFADGVHELQRWTGTGAFASVFPSNVGSRIFTKPKYIEEFSGRQVAAGFADYQSTVWISDAGSYHTAIQSSPQVATDGGYIDVPASLGPITGLKTLRLNTNEAVLIIGCQNGVAMLTGTSALDFAVKEVTREFGVVSNRSWIQAQNDLYFMSTDGLRNFSTSSLAGLLNTRKSALVQDLINKMNRSYSATTFAFFYPATLEAQFWYPVDANTSPAHALIANFNTADPNAAEDYSTNPIFSTKTGISPTCAVYGFGTAFAGTSDGYIMQMYSGDTYNGSAIEWQFVSPLAGGSSPAQSASNRKFIILTEGANQQFVATAYTLTTMSDGVTKWQTQDSRTLSASGSSVTDVSTWASGTTTSYPKLIDFDSRGSGRFWALRLSGSSTSDHIDLVGVQSILTVGGWRQ